MTNRGKVLMEHLFIDEIPIFLVKDMIITVSDQLGDISWGEKEHNEISWAKTRPEKTVINTNTRLKIWYTRGVTKPIPVYDNTFVSEVEGYEPLSIGDVYTGTGDSILLTLVYRKIDITDRYTNIYKYIHRKYNIRSYQNMPEFFEDK